MQIEEGWRDWEAINNVINPLMDQKLEKYRKNIVNFLRCFKFNQGTSEAILKF